MWLRMDTVLATMTNASSSTLAANSRSETIPHKRGGLFCIRTYMDTIPNMAGCDSIITINLVVGNTTNSRSTGFLRSHTHQAVPCIRHQDYSLLLFEFSGCDSIIMINLVVNAPSSSSIGVNACDMYTAPSGAMYTSSGLYTDTITNMMG